MTAKTFPVVDGGRYAVAGDRARILAAGGVELHGRDSVTINTGGEKVFAEEVEQALKRHPAVFDAVVVGRPSERWGQEVIGVVPLRPGHEAASDDELRAAAAPHLARYKLPKAFVRVDRIERSPSGKPDYRWAAAAAVHG
jgi:fatty-acyl-CoA synthase